MSGGHGKIRKRNIAVDSDDNEAEKKRKQKARAAARAVLARKKARQDQQAS